MEKSLQQITLGKVLAQHQKDLLLKWMKENTTGNLRIRAGVPKGWVVADKTGSGSEYGITNDIAIIYPPNCKPIVIASYFTQENKNATTKPDVLAYAAKLLIDDFSKNDPCIKSKI